jgi:hypothetical protein
MIKFKLILFLLLIFFTINSCKSQTNDKKEIIENFAIYRKSLQEKNGILAYTYLDSTSNEWYSKILEIIKFGDSVEICKLNFNDKMTVLATRLIIPKDSILNFNKKTFCIYSINQASIGSNAASSVNIGEIKINNNKAICKVQATPQGDSISLEFNKENSIWKINITSIYEASEILIKKMILSTGMTENEYIYFVIKKISGKRPDDEIWKPLLVKN